MRSSIESAHARAVQAQSRIMAMRRPRLVAFIRSLYRRVENPEGARTPPGRKRSFLGDGPAGAADTIDGTVEIIGDEQRAVFHRQHVHPTSHVLVGLNEAGH